MQILHLYLTNNTNNMEIDKNIEQKQLALFGEEVGRPQVKRPARVGSQNPIIFRDYESYVAKFQDNGPKTTDDTYTPRDVYEAVLRYVGEVYDLSDKLILRPFYPGGDYENAEYPENGVVIDNPPFSLFVPIVKFYTARNIPFFIFGSGLTITNCCLYCTAVIIAEQITFENGAKVKCNFASNLFGDTIIMTAPKLDEYIRACESQETKKPLARIGYPNEVLSCGQMQTICKGGIEFSVKRSECEIIRRLDNLSSNAHKGGLFGYHFILNSEKAASKAASKAAAENVDYVELSDRERKIIEKLDHKLV